MNGAVSRDRRGETEGEATGDPAQGATADVLTAIQAAALLGVARRTVYDLVARDELPHFRVGGAIRFRRHTLERWIDQQEARHPPLPARPAVVLRLPRVGPIDGSPPPIPPTAWSRRPNEKGRRSG